MCHCAGGYYLASLCLTNYTTSYHSSNVLNISIVFKTICGWHNQPTGAEMSMDIVSSQSSHDYYITHSKSSLISTTKYWAVISDKFVAEGKNGYKVQQTISQHTQQPMKTFTSHNNIHKNDRKYTKPVQHFRLLAWCEWDLCSSGMVHSMD